MSRPTSGTPGGGRGAAAAARQDDGPPSTGFFGRAPEFDGSIDGYKTFRKKVEIFAARARSREQEKAVGLEIMQGLLGRAWEVVEDIDITEIEKEKGWMIILQALDRAYKYDQMTELPTDFENFFFKAARKPKETLIDYLTRFRTAEKKVRAHQVELPDKVLGWFLLRRAGLDREGKQLIMNQVGEDLSMEKVESQMKKTFGLDSLPSHRASSGAAAYHIDENEEFEETFDETYYGEEDECYYEDGGSEEHQVDSPSCDAEAAYYSDMVGNTPVP